VFFVSFCVIFCLFLGSVLLCVILCFYNFDVFFIHLFQLSAAIFNKLELICNNTNAKTSSSAVADRACDALCLSVVNLLA